MRYARSAYVLALISALVAETLAAPSPSVEPQGISMALSKRKSATKRTYDEVMEWARNEREYLIRKYNKDDSSTSTEKRGQGSNAIVNQNADSTYFGSLAIGSPAVAFDVILDTGSADLWIAGSDCSQGCDGVSTFDSSKSSTFTNLSTPFSITYGSGAAEGNLAQDVVQMAGFSVSNQVFAVCDAITQNLLNNPVSGLIGLAFQTIASSGATPLWQTLVENGAWDQPVMSFQLTRFGNVRGTQTLEAGGAFTMGFVNDTLFTGDIDYQDIPGGSGSYWIQEISAITVQGNSVSITSGSDSYAAIDTGTTLVGGPSDVISEIYAQIPNSEAAGSGYWAYPCDTDVSVTLAFGGNTWTIDPADFQLEQVTSSQCLGAFFEISSSANSITPPWIIGDTFLKNVYSVFRYNPPSVGFANLSSVATAENGDLDLAVPTPTFGSAAAAVTATSGTRGTTQNSAALPVAVSSTYLTAVVIALLGMTLLQ